MKYWGELKVAVQAQLPNMRQFAASGDAAAHFLQQAACTELLRIVAMKRLQHYGHPFKLQDMLVSKQGMSASDGSLPACSTAAEQQVYFGTEEVGWWPCYMYALLLFSVAG